MRQSGQRYEGRIWRGQKDSGGGDSQEEKVKRGKGTQTDGEKTNGRGKEPRGVCRGEWERRGGNTERKWERIKLLQESKENQEEQETSE